MKLICGLCRRIEKAVLVSFLCAPILCPAGGLIAAWGDDGYGQTVRPADAGDVVSVAAGSWHNLALKPDGTVAAWGANWSRQAQVPAGLSNIIAVAAGGEHSVVLRGDGTVLAWGYDIYGSAYSLTNVPAGLSNVTAIAASYDHTLALKSDGTVAGWGYVYAGSTNVPNDLSNVVAVAAGNGHSLALKSDGTVVGWGDDFAGQATPPDGLSRVKAIAAAANYSLALKADGTVVAWGFSDYGQTNVPGNLREVRAIAAGSSFALALRVDGTVVGWGDGLPPIPDGLRAVTAIAAGQTHALALVSSGPVQIIQGPQDQATPYTSNATFQVTVSGSGTFFYQWYFNGQRLTESAHFVGTTNSSLTISNAQFTDIGSYSVRITNSLGGMNSAGAKLTVVSPPFITQQPVDRTVRAGSDVTFAATASGTPPLSYQWNFNGTDIPGATANFLTFADVQPARSGYYYLRVTNVYGVAETGRALLTVTDSPPYFVRFPSNQVAVLGADVLFDPVVRGSAPLFYQWRFNGVPLPGATNLSLRLNSVTYDQTGYYMLEAGNAFGGTNSPKVFLNVSQVELAGLPFLGNTNMPAGLTNIVAVAAGGSHVMALRSDGTVRTWLANANFLFGSPSAVTNVPSSATNVVAIAAGYDHCLALRSNGTVVAWGYSGTHTNVPVGLSNVVGIAAGASRSFAVKSDGTVVGWGQTPAIPAGLSNVVAMASSSAANYALKRDGSVVAWSSTGPIQFAAPLTNVIALAAGSSFSVGGAALRQDGTVMLWGNGTTGAPYLLTPASNAVAVAAGSGAWAVLKQDGSLLATAQERAQFPKTNQVIAVALGGVQSPLGIAIIGDDAPRIALQPVSQVLPKSSTTQLHARAVGRQPMSYQWLHDGLPMSGATNGSLVLTNVLGVDTGDYRVIAINALGATTSRVATISIPFEYSLAAALNATNLQWETDRPPTNWFVQIRETHDGIAAAQSGVIGNGQKTTLHTAYLPNPGTLTFWWKVSSEESFDFLSVYVDQSNLNQSTTPVFSISGETAWEQRTVTFTNGNHFVRWVYSKDGSVSSGRDAGWVDEVSFTLPPPVVSITPGAQTVRAGSNVSFFATTLSYTKPVYYQWLFNGTNLDGATNQNLSLPNVGRKDQGSYSVWATNAGGVTLASNATLNVIVPQQLSQLRCLPNGCVELLSRDADGAAVAPADLLRFEAQASANLVDWVVLPDALSVTNGWLLLRDPAAATMRQRFYRVREH